MAGSSPFDEMLAEGRRQLDAMTGAAARDDQAPAAQTADAPRTIAGTSGGIPFRLTLPRGRGQ